MKPVEPVETVELFPGLSEELIELLKHLSPGDWARETVCTGWSVRDVVAHLLGGSLGRLAYGRDRQGMDWQAGGARQAGVKGFTDLLDLINSQNAEWVLAARRISPHLLIQFLEVTEPQLYRYFKTLPPFGTSGAGVAWAGDVQSPNWFDIAREYTEKWLHQQHIREAVGRPVLAERKWLFPVLDTFLRALPYTYRDVGAAEGTAVCFHIQGEAGGDWSLIRQDGAWELWVGEASQAASSVNLDQDLAWRLFTRGIAPEKARDRVSVAGDQTLGMHILHVVSIMA